MQPLGLENNAFFGKHSKLKIKIYVAAHMTNKITKMLISLAKGF